MDKPNKLFIGFYPQRIINLNNGNNTKQRIVKIIANPDEENISTFSNGEKVIKGKEYSFLIEPVEWRLIGEKYYLCEKILDTSIYDKKIETNKDPVVIEWLKNEFLKTLLNDERTYEIKNIDLLEYCDMFKQSLGFIRENKDTETRVALLTDYAIARGAWNYEDRKKGVWWLKRIDFEKPCAPVISSTGLVSCCEEIDSPYIGVRPVISIKYKE